MVALLFVEVVGSPSVDVRRRRPDFIADSFPVAHGDFHEARDGVAAPLCEHLFDRRCGGEFVAKLFDGHRRVSVVDEYIIACAGGSQGESLRK